MGNVLNAGFDQVFNMYNQLVIETGDIIDTYVYRMLVESSNIGQSSAVSLYQSIMGLVIVLGTNALTKKLDPDSALF